MKLFGRKDRKNGRPSATDGTRVTAHSGGAPLAHRITKDLERAETLAAMLAHSRAALVVEVADLLAGMYIYDWERLSQFWDGNDEIEIFLQQICRISPQRWHHWIADYDQQRREEEPPSIARAPVPTPPQNAAWFVDGDGGQAQDDAETDCDEDDHADQSRCQKRYRLSGSIWRGAAEAGNSEQQTQDRGRRIGQHREDQGDSQHQSPAIEKIAQLPPAEAEGEPSRHIREKDRPVPGDGKAGEGDEPNETQRGQRQ